MAAFEAIGDHAGIEAQEGSVESEDALDVREHEVGGCRVVLSWIGMRCTGDTGEGGIGGEVGGRRVCGGSRGGDRCLGGEKQVCLCGYYAAHRVADENRMNGGFDGRRGSGVCDFDVDDLVQEPGRLVREDPRVTRYVRTILEILLRILLVLLESRIEGRRGRQHRR